MAGGAPMRGASRASCRAMWSNIHSPWAHKHKATSDVWDLAEHKRVEQAQCPTGATSGGTGSEQNVCVLWVYTALSATLIFISEKVQGKASFLCARVLFLFILGH